MEQSLSSTIHIRHLDLSEHLGFIMQIQCPAVGVNFPPQFHRLSNTSLIIQCITRGGQATLLFDGLRLSSNYPGQWPLRFYTRGLWFQYSHPCRGGSVAFFESFRILRPLSLYCSNLLHPDLDQPEYEVEMIFSATCTGLMTMRIPHRGRMRISTTLRRPPYQGLKSSSPWAEPPWYSSSNFDYQRDWLNVSQVSQFEPFSTGHSRPIGISHVSICRFWLQRWVKKSRRPRTLL